MNRLVRRLALSLLITLPGASAALAECVGQNLIAALPADERAELQAAADAVPHATGLFWRATRGADVIHLIGTYHFDDPRHAATLALLSPVLDGATALLVEAGPEEESALKQHLARDPSLMIATEGPTLRESLPEDEWLRLSKAVSDRGIPPFMAAKMRPWYLSLLLGIPACDMARVTGGAQGLDAQLVEEAEARAIPVQALEPYDTIFSIFKVLPEEDQVGMITSALMMEERSADFSVTLADSYFSQDSRLIWEFMRHESGKLPGYTPEKVAAEFDLMERALMIDRNKSWIPVIEAAAAKGPVLAAFGALHLSGENGVLALLEREGFTVERLALQ